MPNLMTTAAQVLGAKLQGGTAARRVAGRSATYRQGLRTSDAITGWVAKNEYQVMSDDESYPVIASFYDWSFVVDELLLDDETVEPRPGDRIVCEGATYEVLPLPGRPVSERDATGTLVRVHTKRIVEA